MKTKVIPFILFFLFLFVYSTQAQITAKGFIGDGSQLTNVKPLITYYDGRSYVAIPENGDDVIVGSVTIVVPAAGTLLISANGFAEFRGSGVEIIRLCISTRSILENDHITGCTDGSSSVFVASGWLTSRIYYVGAAGSYTYNCICDKYSNGTSDEISIGNTKMTAMYFPTGATGAAPPPPPPLKSADINEKSQELGFRPGILDRSVRGSRSDNIIVNQNNKKDTIIEQLQSQMKQLNEKVERLMRQQK